MECCNHSNHNNSPASSGNYKEHKEHDKHKGHSVEMFSKKFWVSLVLTVPVVLYSELPQKFFGWQTPLFPGVVYSQFILSSIVFFYGGWVFIMGAWEELKVRLPGMMALISLAISAAYFYSVFAVFSGRGHTLFWELTTLITIMLLGHWIEMKAVSGARGALKELAKLLPDTAEVIIQNSGAQMETKIIPLAELKEGNVVLVRPGAKIPADGVIIEGKSDVNESMITGESRPVEKNIGAKVIAGTINGDGSLRVKVAFIGEHTFLAGIMKLIKEAESSKSRLQILSDRAAFYLTLIAVVSGGITFIAWILAEAGIIFAFERLVAVLVIACPHALGLAVPLVASISTTLAARNGLLIKRRLALEMARQIDVVLFDKTGTLTKGEYGVSKIVPNPLLALSSEEILQLAASVDSESEHFAAKAIVNEANLRKLPLLEVKNFQRIAGKGVGGTINNKEILVGGENILGNMQLSPEFENSIKVESEKGKTIIFVIRDKKVIGALALSDLIREESRQAIEELKKIGVKTAMITGDSEDVAKWVAKELGIDEYFAKVLPNEKSDKVKILQNQGLKVAMVGDGVNDAPALTQADVGIAIGAGTNVAIESAGIILVKSDPRDIVKIIKLSRLTYRKMIENLFWATGYNVIALPLGAGVLAAYGILLQPALAAVFMSLSTIIVAINAILLKRSII